VLVVGATAEDAGVKAAADLFVTMLRG
jgi:hypothetical protein